MEQHDFSADRPIVSIDEDLLDRGRFAESLSKAISGWKGKDSLIVALHGDWGSGKSSLKNMALSAFEKQNLEKPLLVDFNPWEWAGQDKISKSFFEQLASSIGQQDKSKKRKAIAKKIRLYGLYLNSGATLVTGLTAALPTLFALAAIFGFGGIFADQPWVKNTLGSLIAIIIAWAAFLKWGGKFAGQLSGIAEEHANCSELTLDRLKSSLAADLKSMEKPLLVIIDDIDRLTSEETRVMFQLVKANADFPNVVYLLMFQRDIVEQRLSDETQAGRDYLEKIIQVPFDIPRIEQSRLEKILFASLDRILEEDQKILERFDRTRWGNLFYGGLRPFFMTLRNVYRYSSTFSFYVSLLKGDNAFEVNPVDLIAIECLRIFEPDAYKSISLSKELLTSSHRDNNRNEHAGNELTKIVGMASEERRESVKEILKQLFPTIESLLGGYSYGSDFSERWFKELRVCHPDVFPRYFQFSIPVGDISQSDLEEIISLSGDREALVQKLNLLKDAGLLKAALSQLDTYKQDIPLENSDAFIPALMDIGDTSENQSGGSAGFSTHLHLVRIVLWYLRQEDSIEDRGNRLLSAFSKTDGLSLMAHILAGEDSRREKQDKAELLLTNDAILENAKKVFVEKLEGIAQNEPKLILSNIHLAYLLFRWKEWDELKKIRDWLVKVITIFEDLLIFLDGFTSQTTSQGMGDYVARIKHRINLGNVETFLSLDRLRELIKHGDREKLSERQRQVLDAIEAAFRHREKGYADDAWDDDYRS
ncbi:AAA family ATPase [bacterium]|nr:AAA family ATPase [bacterium]